MDDKNLMDDVELFVNDKINRKPQTSLPASINDLYKSPSSASSMLRDVFIFNNNDPIATSTFVDDVPTDNLLGFSDWTIGGGAKSVEDTHDWPELPSVSVENYVRSSRSSSSTTIDNQLRRGSLDKIINHVPLLPPRPSVKDQTSSSSNNINAAVPPRINRATTPLTSKTMSNGKLANGNAVANHTVNYKKNHNHGSNFDVVDDGDNDEDEDVDEDDVFFGYESMKPLINVNNHKKKVRFLDGSSRVSSEQTEMNIGGSGGDALIVKKGRSCRYAMIRFGYLMIANAALAAIVCSLIYLPPLLKSKRNVDVPTIVIQCKKVTVEYNDNFTFQQYFPTSEMKLFNLTNDRRLCVVFGFGSYGFPCDSGRNCQRRGGVLAFDLTNGKELWKTFTADEILGVNCREDVDGDRFIDCAVGGRSGILEMISGFNGAVIWEFLPIVGRYRDVLTPQWVSDASGDGVADILATVNAETDDNEMTLYLLSGKTGQSLSGTDNVVNVRSMKSENAAIVWRHGDVALEEIVWASGTLKLTGGLSIFSLRALRLGKIEENQILYTNASIVSRPIFVDLNDDGYKDLLVCSLSGEVIAYSGALPHKILWQYVRPQSQCSSLIISGSFENDTCPDIIVTFNVGDGFPNYKFFETILLKGRTGVESERLFTSTLPFDPRATSIKMNGVGNDIVLGFNFGCISGLPKYLDAGFSSLSAPQTLQELFTVGYCNQLYDSKRSYELFAARKSFRTSLFSSSAGNSKMFEKSPQFNDWVTQNGLDVESFMMQIGQMIALNVSADGSALSILVPTYFSSASDLIVFPKECFSNPRDFMTQGRLPEKCRRFMGGRQKRKKMDGGENSMISGFTVLNRITLRCGCDQQLKQTETCSKFLPV